mmetsp:Transcript_22213/g.54648  ORF Transcript_22213/g.54648 Transcript_22213/m.54648 type:complete len:231 (-) Transcript_22213:1459-2151(-)
MSVRGPTISCSTSLTLASTGQGASATPNTCPSPSWRSVALGRSTPSLPRAGRRRGKPAKSICSTVRRPTAVRWSPASKRLSRTPTPREWPGTQRDSTRRMPSTLDLPLVLRYTSFGPLVCRLPHLWCSTCWPSCWPRASAPWSSTAHSAPTLQRYPRTVPVPTQRTGCTIASSRWVCCSSSRRATGGTNVTPVTARAPPPARQATPSSRSAHWALTATRTNSGRGVSPRR